MTRSAEGIDHEREVLLANVAGEDFVTDDKEGNHRQCCIPEALHRSTFLPASGLHDGTCISIFVVF
jgi:hypothetical protein